MAKAQAAARRKRGNFITRYFRESVAELRKVTWPTREEATRLTIIVLVVLLVTSAIMGLLDFLFTRLIAFILTLG